MVKINKHLGRTLRKVLDRRSKALALDGGHPLVVVVGHEVAVDARLREAPTLQLLRWRRTQGQKKNGYRIMQPNREKVPFAVRLRLINVCHVFVFLDVRWVTPIPPVSTTSTLWNAR